MKFKKVIAYICVVAISISVINPVYAETENDELLNSKDDETSQETVDLEEKETEEEPLKLTAESAVEYGLEHNKTIEILENKIQIALISSKNAKTNSSDLSDAKELLRDAENELFDSKKALEAGKEDFEKAVSALKMGIAPMNLSAKDSEGEAFVIKAGSSILQAFMQNGFTETEAAKEMSDLINDFVSSSQDTYNYSSAALEAAETEFEIKEEEFKAILEDTSETIDTKINYGSVIDLDADDAGELMIKMAGVNLDVTKYAKDIYKNQIAMLIQKNYYDALYAGKVYDLKKVAMERGEKQYNTIKLSYENGMKAKDDLLLSKMYYDSTIISCRLAEADYKNSLYELKENMNLDMNQEIILDDSILKEVTEENLEEGLKSGLTNRIEIRQSLGQLVIYELNEEILNSRAEYKPYTKGLKEAELLREGAELELDKTKTSIKSEINQSYETMVATGEMLEAANELIANAEEVVNIAKLKYEQGFGAENSLLKQMNLQESSGTIIELIAAQENLAEVESQVAQIRYSYTMAKIKYLNDSGILIY